ETVLSPAVCPASRLVVREIGPGRPIRRVVFTDSTPLPLGEVRSPPLPVGRAFSILRETQRLCIPPGVTHETSLIGSECHLSSSSLAALVVDLPRGGRESLAQDITRQLRRHGQQLQCRGGTVRLRETTHPLL